MKLIIFFYFRGQRDRSFTISMGALKTRSVLEEKEEEAYIALRYLEQLDLQAYEYLLTNDSDDDSDREVNDSDEEYIVDPEDLEPPQSASSVRNYMDLGPVGDILESTTVSGPQAFALISSYEVAKQRANGAEVFDASQFVSCSKLYYARVKVSVCVLIQSTIYES